MQRTEMINHATYQQIIGTISGVNSPHPNKVRADEVELMKPRVVEEMKMMPHTSNGYRSSLVCISSRKYAHGNMQKLFLEATKDGHANTILWCYKETAQACPEERRGREKKIFETPDLSNPERFIKFVAWEKCGECPLLSTCRGELAYASGFENIDDLIKEYKRLDASTWVAQKESGAPSLQDLVYPSFQQREPWCGKYPYRPELPTYVAVDFGYQDPFVALVIQEDKRGSEPPHYYVVAEYAQIKTQLLDNLENLKMMIKELGGNKPIVYIVDSADATAVEIMELQGFPVEPIIKKKVSHTIPLVRSKLLTASGQTYLHIDESCETLISEMQAYHYPECGGETPVDADNHGMDALRYFFVYLDCQQEPLLSII
jgi:hypothetical protein